MAGKISSTIILYFLLLLLFPAVPIFFTAFLSQDSIVATLVKKMVFVIWGLSFFAFFILILRPRLLLFLSIPLVLLACLEVYIIFIIRAASEEGIILSVLGTNPGEAFEILSANSMYLLFSVLYTAVYMYLLSKVPASFRLPVKMKVRLIILVLLVQAAVVARDLQVALNTPDGKAPWKYIEYAYSEKMKKTFPINWLYNTVSYAGKQKKIARYEGKIKDFRFNVSNEDSIYRRRVVAIVIGETARKHNFSLYGYERKTNPRLEKEPGLIIINKAETVFNNTFKAYTVFLSRATPDNFDLYLEEPSLIKAFSEAGFQTVYISNQGLPYGSIYKAYSEQADTLVNLYTSMNRHATDERIIPVFKEILQNSENQDLCVIIHSIGSHFRYNMRYPERFEHFAPAIGDDLDLAFVSEKQRQELINAYDNSILFTDYFLSELITGLHRDTSSASLLFYASDHGENIFDTEEKKFAHGGPEPSRFEKEIPLLIWRSEQYDKMFSEKIANVQANQDKPVNTTHFFPTILDLSGIVIESEGRAKSFAKEDF